MRLLSSKTLEFEEFFNLDDIPQYAILSHTWQGNEEVSYEEMLKPCSRTKQKSGYQKILNTAKQAQSDGMQYFWVDTCCINKSSSAELTESINCMLISWLMDWMRRQLANVSQQCTNGIKKVRVVTYTFPTSNYPSFPTKSLAISRVGKTGFSKQKPANGTAEAGHYKNYWHQGRSGFTIETGHVWETKLII